MGDRSVIAVLRASIAEGLGTSGLRRLQGASGAASLASWTFFVVLAVYAYRSGGATAVGVVALARMVPAGLAAPLAGLLVDRLSRRDVLLASVLVRAAVVGAIAVAVGAGAPFVLVVVIATVSTIVGTAHNPAQAALLPRLAETPRQLGAANALWTCFESGAFLAGSLAGGALIALTSLQAAFGATAAVYALAALALAAIPRDPAPDYRATGEERHPLGDLVDGVREVMAHRDVRLVVGFFTVATLVEGAVDVLVVLVAIQLLHLGDAGVGWLNAAWGLGGMAGGGAALALLGRGRLSAGLAAGGLLVGGALMVIAAVVAPAVALAMLVALGVGYALIEAAGRSLLQRLSSDEVLGRAFAVVEATYWVATGLGAIVAPAVVAVLGARGAVLAIGVCLPLVVVLRWRALARFEEDAVVPEAEFRALRALSLFAALPLATVENLAQRAARMPVAAGEVVVRRGDSGQDFYVIADGIMDVSDCDGEPGPLGAGDFFGEIALLRDVPRTATVTARDGGVLYVLDRNAFLAGVGAHRRTVQAAEDVVGMRLRAAAGTASPAEEPAS